MKTWLIALSILAAGALAGYALAPRPPGPSAPAPTVAAPAEVRAEGQVVAYPGAEVTLASEQPGTLVRFDCLEKRPVLRGETIAVLRHDENRAAVAEAAARVREAGTEANLAEAELGRALDLAGQGFYSRQAVDRAEQALASARARRDSARATVRRLEAALDKTVIVAPIAGTVVGRLAEAGETVTAGQGLCAIADLGRLRLEVEVDEYDAGRIAQGAGVQVSAEGYDGRSWQGRVEEIPDAVVARRLRPQDPARPVDVRVLLVKVALMEATPLKLGQRVEVRIGRL